jgi:hypothetical protein
LLKLSGQETQLGVLGTPRLVLYTTSMEGYGMYWNMAEWGARREESSRTRWKQMETTGNYYSTMTSHRSAGPGSPATLTHMATCTHVDF